MTMSGMFYAARKLDFIYGLRADFAVIIITRGQGLELIREVKVPELPEGCMTTGHPARGSTQKSDRTHLRVQSKGEGTAKGPESAHAAGVLKE